MQYATSQRILEYYSVLATHTTFNALHDNYKTMTLWFLAFTPIHITQQ